MTIARHYSMHAKEGQSATLETELRKLADLVRPVPGNVGVEVLRDLGNEQRFFLIEKWETVEAHKGAGKHIPREALGGLVATLDGPMDGAYLDYLVD
jgi:heme oxygenase (mycobilin-producing)